MLDWKHLHTNQFVFFVFLKSSGFFLQIFVSQIFSFLKLFFHLRLCAPARWALKARWQSGGIPGWSLGVCVQQRLGGWRRCCGLQTAWRRVRGRAHMCSHVSCLLCSACLLLSLVLWNTGASTLTICCTDSNCNGILRPDGVMGIPLMLTTLTNLKGTPLHFSAKSLYFSVWPLYSSFILSRGLKNL